MRPLWWQRILTPDGDATAGLLFFDPSDPVRESWTALPRTVAALIQPPHSHFAVIIRNSAYQETGRFRDVSDPIWDWLIRAARGGPIAVLDAAEHPGARLPVQWPSLAPRRPDQAMDWLKGHIEKLGSDALMSDVVKAGLLQLHDFLDESHRLSQGHEGDRDADYWHGIMHRREPDYSNAKYWFRRVGDHSIFAQLARQAQGILQRCSDDAAGRWMNQLFPRDGWDPLAFVDLCERCEGSNDALAVAAREVQFVEMLLLLEHSHRAASG